MCGDLCRRGWGHPPWGKHEAALGGCIATRSAWWTAEWSSSGAAACVRDRLWVLHLVCLVLCGHDSGASSACLDESVASRPAGKGSPADMDLLDMACLFDVDGGELPPCPSNASVRNFPSDATLNAEAGAAKGGARGTVGASPAPPSPSSRRERDGEVVAGMEGEARTGSGSRAGGTAAQPPHARGKPVMCLGVDRMGRCGDQLRCLVGIEADLCMTAAGFAARVGGVRPWR